MMAAPRAIAHDVRIAMRKHRDVAGRQRRRLLRPP